MEPAPESQEAPSDAMGGDYSRLWRRLQVIYADELPAIPLYFRAEPYVLPKWLKGLEPTGHQDLSTLWVERWRAE